MGNFLMLTGQWRNPSSMIWIDFSYCQCNWRLDTISGVVMISTYIFTAECSDQVCLVSSVAADCDWETTSLEKPTALGSWAVGRCRLAAGAPVVREMAVRGMKGRERKFRKIKYLHLSCLQQNDYQVMRLQKHDDNDMSKSIGKYELPIIIKWGEICGNLIF